MKGALVLTILIFLSGYPTPPTYAAPQSGAFVNLFTPCANGLQVDINGVAEPANLPVAGPPFSWNWGDGTTTPPSDFPYSHTYTAQGTYTVTVTATWDDGESASASEQVTVTLGIVKNCTALTITAGSGGSVAYQTSVKSGVLSPGSFITLQQGPFCGGQLTAMPDTQGAFSYWSASVGITGISGAPLNTASPSIEIVVDSPSTIVANFVPATQNPNWVGQGVKNEISFYGLAVETPLSPECPPTLQPLSNLTCFTIQQNVYLSTPSNPAIPAYWAQNALLVWQTFAGGWVVAHEFELWTSDAGGETLYGTLLACSPGSPRYNQSNGKWSCSGAPIFGGTLQPNSELVTTVSQTLSGASLSFLASTGQTVLPPFSYQLPLGSSILAANNVQQGVQLIPTWEPEFMLVGWGDGATATFQPGTLGTVNAYFPSGAQPWQSAGSQYPNGTACKSTGESSTGLLWTVPVNGATTTFGTADTNAGGVAAQGIIFVPAEGVALYSCE
jgi:hypothetical protein